MPLCSARATKARGNITKFTFILLFLLPLLFTSSDYSSTNYHFLLRHMISGALGEHLAGNRGNFFWLILIALGKQPMKYLRSTRLLLLRPLCQSIIVVRWCVAVSRSHKQTDGRSRERYTTGNVLGSSSCYAAVTI